MVAVIVNSFEANSRPPLIIIDVVAVSFVCRAIVVGITRVLTESQAYALIVDGKIVVVVVTHKYRRRTAEIFCDRENLFVFGHISVFVCIVAFKFVAVEIIFRHVAVVVGFVPRGFEFGYADVIENHGFDRFTVSIDPVFFVRKRVYRVFVPTHLICGGNVRIRIVFFVELAIEKAKRIHKFTRAFAHVDKIISAAVFTLFVRVYKAIFVVFVKISYEFLFGALKMLRIHRCRVVFVSSVKVVIAESERPRFLQFFKNLRISLEKRRRRHKKIVVHHQISVDDNEIGIRLFHEIFYKLVSFVVAGASHDFVLFKEVDLRVGQHHKPKISVGRRIYRRIPVFAFACKQKRRLGLIFLSARYKRDRKRERKHRYCKYDK